MYNTALQLCRKTDQYDKAKSIFESMPAWKVPQDNTAYAEMLETTRRHGEWAAALQILEQPTQLPQPAPVRQNRSGGRYGNSQTYLDQVREVCNFQTLCVAKTVQVL